MMLRVRQWSDGEVVFTYIGGTKGLEHLPRVNEYLWVKDKLRRVVTVESSYNEGWELSVQVWIDAPDDNDEIANRLERGRLAQ